jgi:hypothetical protein
VLFRVLLTALAREQLLELERTDPRRASKVKRTLGILEQNPRHPGLHSHEYQSLHGLNGEKIWESYVENNTSAAFRVFWHYRSDQIVVIAITAHP